jgi:twitching motility protein PilT
MVGEMRDLETIGLAITAAETGHLVYGTLHTSGAAKTVDRIIDAFPEEQQNQIRTMIADTLRGVISQILVKRADTQGRAAAFEILVTTPAVSNLIREGKTFQITSAIQTGKKEGMVTLDQSLMNLMMTQKITAEEAFRNAVNKDMFFKYVIPTKRSA